MSKSNICSKPRLLTLKRGSWRLFRDSRGLSTVEYVIILVLVAAVCVATWTAFGNKVKLWLGVGTGIIDAEINGTGIAAPGNGPAPGEAKEPKKEAEPTVKRKIKPGG